MRCSGYLFICCATMVDSGSGETDSASSLLPLISCRLSSICICSCIFFKMYIAYVFQRHIVLGEEVLRVGPPGCFANPHTPICFESSIFLSADWNLASPPLLGLWDLVFLSNYGSIFQRLGAVDTESFRHRKGRHAL